MILILLDIYFNGLEKDATTRMEVIQALGSATSMIWLVMTPFLGVCFILGESIDKRALIAHADGPEVLFIRQYSLKRRTVRQGDEEKADEKEIADGDDDDVKTIEGVRLPEKKEIEETRARA